MQLQLSLCASSAALTTESIGETPKNLFSVTIEPPKGEGHTAYKTEVKSDGSGLFFSVPVDFVEPLKWYEGATIDIEIVGGIIQIQKLDF